ncbi:unnamed protein product [Spirodela intermedia]|uniref:FMP27/BLTP2/Hobbit GFWDK motif-containing RBG unit domain-containing protein n=1 Tax=Spirodela intermedia TaxID=51605 RepID=A0A7I8ILI7_SPIIN|nr:unnamed protein product [Spirodela intermedia]CAA6657811.1 unnamed protein product [Spirodela intermedia]
MASSPVKFLYVFLLVCILGWVVVKFFSRLLAWFLSRIFGASVGLRIAGCNCLRDVTVKFRKGAVESVSVGEVKLSLRKSLVKLGFSFISRDPKLRFLISDLEIKSRLASRGKWMLLVNVARFLSVSITDLVLRAPKATIDVKELTVDISKIGGSNTVLLIKLHLLPFLVYICDERLSYDRTSDNNQLGCLPTGHHFAGKNSAPFVCEDLSVLCELGHEREVGLKVSNMDVTSGEIIMNLDESLFVKSKAMPGNFDRIDLSGGSNSESLLIQRSQKDEKSYLSLKKHALVFPDKVSFNLPKLDVRFVHQGHRTSVDNNVMGIRLQCTKLHSFEDSDEATSHFDVLLDFSEIYLLREGPTSVLEIMKVAVVASFDVPTQPAVPIRAEIDVKLGGTQCNLIMNRLKPWLELHMSKKKHVILPEESMHAEGSRKNELKSIMWTCTVSAPEMTIMLYGLDGSPLYHGCSQSSHLFANNIAYEYQECLKENLFGVETNSDSLMHIARVSLDWGHKEIESSEEPNSKHWKLICCVDITGMGVFFDLKNVESLISTVMSFRSLLRRLSTGRKMTDRRSTKAGGRGVQILKLNLERCSVNFSGDIIIKDAIVPDPKRVNFGSHGGNVVFTASPDGIPRRATITSTLSNDCKHLNYLTSLEIFHLSASINKEKKSLQMEIRRTKAIYEELSEEERPGAKVVLFDMKNAKLVRRTGSFNEISVCSLFSASDITMRWEPDAHLTLYELFLRLKIVLNNQKLQAFHNEGLFNKKHSEKVQEVINDQVQSSKLHKTRESVFAIDVEMLRLSAELADGVEAMVHVQSIFSENARIGMLLEGLVCSLNEARVLKSSRMQISRIPVSTANAPQVVCTWDWVVQGLDVHICMPYRIQLRAIEDAIEDMLRALKLITTARSSLLTPSRKDVLKKVKGKSNFGCVKFNIRKLTADIEEEPIQGWLDEHYHLMRNVVCESAVRMKFLDDILSDGNILGSEKNFEYNGVIIDTNDLFEIEKLKDEIHNQAFRSYYLACQKMSPSEGSGACRRGFQSGFQPSTARSSLLCLTATELDLTLTEIEGGDTGMLRFINRVDPLSSDCDIPFSRFYGRKMILQTTSLIIRLRNYTFPLFSGYSGRCEGLIVLAQQIHQDVFIGRWRRVRMLRSASGTTPPMKMYSDLPIFFQKGEVSFGVGYEPAFADISYAFTVALRRASLSVRSKSLDMKNVNSQPVKKERSLPWWDDVRYYIHGKISLSFNETKWNFLATTNPYEKLDKFQIVSGFMDIQKTDGHVIFSAKDFKIFLTSLESLTNNCDLKLPAGGSFPFIDSPSFSLEVDMDWDCESGNPLNHYLHALPAEGEPRKKVYDTFRSISLSLRWSFSLRPSFRPGENQNMLLVMPDGSVNEHFNGSPQNSDSNAFKCPTMNLGAHDLVWIFKWWNLNYNPPHKLRSFSRWPRFGIPRVARSGNLSLDKVMTEFFLRLDSTPTCIKHMPLGEDDPASELTFQMTKLKYELCYSRGKQHYTFDCKRDPLDLIYQGLDLHLLKAYLNRIVTLIFRTEMQISGADVEKHRDEGFLLYSDYFTIRKQAPKADPARLLAWQKAGKKNPEMSYVRSEFENGSESDCTRSDPSDDDGFNVVIADNCQRIFVYGLKLLWTIENRDAVWSWVGGISKAFEPPKPSPSRQYAQRKLTNQKRIGERSQDDIQPSAQSASRSISAQSPQHDAFGIHSSPSTSSKVECSSSGVAEGKHQEIGDFDFEGIRHFMVNVIQPQFNLQSEEANGRFLLAAASGRLLARSLDSVLQVASEMIEQLSNGSMHIKEHKPRVLWKRAEYSAMLEHVQAHVAPTDVDPGAGLQWLPKILRSSPKVKRTGALLERVFMPCTMYFRYTRHKGGTTDLKVKPLKELSFNSANITATMTSRQFQVMLDILSNLLFARLPKPRKSSLSYPAEDDDVEEEADEVVPDGVEEVELAKVSLEQRERERKLLLDDIRTLLASDETSSDAGSSLKKDSILWMVCGGKPLLSEERTRNIQKSRKAASSALRLALQKAALLRLMEKEKNKSPSCAMRISMKIDKVAWSMLADGKAFAEAEIINMMYDFDRDYKDIGVAQFITKSFFVRNCLPNAKSNMLLSAWNAPPELGRNVMLRVDARQGVPKDGISSLELFQVEIYPLKIHLTETMYRMMWGYFFPEEEQDSHRRQEVWKVSTTASSRRTKKTAPGPDAATLGNHGTREVEAASKSSANGASSVVSGASLLSAHGDSSQTSKLQSLKANIICGSNSELRRASSFDRSLEENVCESVTNAQVHASSTSKSGPLCSPSDHQNNVNDETARGRSKEPRSVRAGRSPHDEKKVGKSHDEKRTRVRKLMEFHNIKISQVELLVTYEGSRFAVNDLRLLMDTFHRDDFTGTWRRLFSRVKKHIIWGVLKSVTGMQGKKFKHKAQGQRDEGSAAGVPDSDLNFSDSDGGLPGSSVQFPTSLLKRPSDGAGEGFVTSIRGLFNSQRRRAKAFMLRTMRGEADPGFHGEWSESDVEAAPFARQLTITKAKKLMRRHTKKFRARGLKVSGSTSQQRESLPSSPKETTPFESDSSSDSPYEDVYE